MIAADGDIYNDILDECEVEARESDGEMDFFRGDWTNYIGKSREPHKLLLGKLNLKKWCSRLGAVQFLRNWLVIPF